MNRLVWTLVAAIALAVPTAGSGAPPLDEVHGPRCADFQGSIDYVTNAGGVAQLTVRNFAIENGASCDGGTYVVTVAASDGTTLATHTYVGDGVTAVFDNWTTTLAGNPASVRVSIASYFRGPNAVDTASATVLLDGGAGATSFR